jgi:hypothetical protein
MDLIITELLFFYDIYLLHFAFIGLIIPNLLKQKPNTVTFKMSSNNIETTRDFFVRKKIDISLIADIQQHSVEKYISCTTKEYILLTIIKSPYRFFFRKSVTSNLKEEIAYVLKSHNLQYQISNVDTSGLKKREGRISNLIPLSQVFYSIRNAFIDQRIVLIVGSEYHHNIKTNENKTINMYKINVQVFSTKKISNGAEQFFKNNLSITLERSSCLNNNRYFPTNELWKLFSPFNSASKENGPNYEVLSEKDFKVYKNSVNIGYIDNDKNRPIYVHATDFKQGSVVAGRSGSGKTTLRLILMKYLIENDINIIDIDFKGDAPQYKFFRDQGQVYVPMVNLQINIFELDEMAKDFDLHESVIRSYSNELYNILALTFKDDLTPPQEAILREAIIKTVAEQGNSRIFLQNIYYVSVIEKSIVDNRQDASATALINKLQWLQVSLGKIFWHEKSNISFTEIAEQNSFFDLQVMSLEANNEQMRFLVNYIALKIKNIATKWTDCKSTIDGLPVPRTVIFIDEAQNLVPRTNKSSPIVSIATTMRYKGLITYISGVDAGKINDEFTNASFIAQFGSNSDALYKSLGLESRSGSAIISNLRDYTTYLKCGSTLMKAVKVTTKIFSLIKSEDEYREKFLTSPIFPTLSSYFKSESTYYTVELKVMLEKLGANIIDSSHYLENLASRLIQENSILNLENKFSEEIIQKIIIKLFQKVEKTVTPKYVETLLYTSILQVIGEHFTKRDLYTSSASRNLLLDHYKTDLVKIIYNEVSNLLSTVSYLNFIDLEKIIL